MHFGQVVIRGLATGLGVGGLPFAPGTFGSLLGLGLCWWIGRWHWVAGLAFILLFILAAIWIAGEAESILQQEDPGAVVIDEVAGMLVALAAVPFNLATATTGFCLFRVLDIFKPFPIRNLERKLHGGTAVVLDDVLAGLLVNLILRIGWHVKRTVW